jgi:hypothetical protein
MVIFQYLLKSHYNRPEYLQVRADLHTLPVESCAWIGLDSTLLVCTHPYSLNIYRGGGGVGGMLKKVMLENENYLL